MNPQSERKCLGDAAVTGTGTVHVWLVCVLSKLTPFHSNVENKGFFVSCSLLITKQSQWNSCGMEPSSLWVERDPSIPSEQLLEFGCQSCVGALNSTTSLSTYPFTSQTFAPLRHLKEGFVDGLTSQCLLFLYPDPFTPPGGS